MNLLLAVVASSRGDSDQLGRAVERSPRQLYLTEILPRLHLVPADDAPRRRQRKVVAAPDDLVLADAEQFAEVVLARRVVVPVARHRVEDAIFQLACATIQAAFAQLGSGAGVAFRTPHIHCRGVDSIRRIHHGQIEVFVWNTPHIVEAIQTKHLTNWHSVTLSKSHRHFAATLFVGQRLYLRSQTPLTLGVVGAY